MKKDNAQPNDRHYRLSLYLDDLLNAADRQAIEAELQADPELRAELEQLRRIDAFIREWGRAVPEADAEAFVAEARRRREAIGRPRVSRVYRVGAALAAAAVLLVAATMYIWIGNRAKLTAIEEGSVVSVRLVTPGRQDVATVTGEEPTVSVSFSMAPAEDGRERRASTTMLVATAGTSARDDEITPEAEPPFF